MIAGRVPFSGETINHTVVAILEKEPPVLENAPAELQRIISKAMSKDADVRYQSARDLLIDLKNLRRELDIKGEIERSVSPKRDTTSNIDSENQTRAYAATNVAATVGTQAKSTSSLEYAVNQAKGHKLGAIAIVLLIVGVISTVGYFVINAKRSSGSG